MPHLCTVETASVFRSWVRRSEVDSWRASAAIEDLQDFEAIRYPHEPLLTRAWELRENFSAYDGVYVALAESLGAPLLTCDGRLSRAPLPGITVELVHH
jgi:predicted nucleic acid-binding protein